MGRGDSSNGKSPDIPTRAFDFAVRIVHVCRHLDKEPGVSRTLSAQLLRSGTSIGSNIEEGQAAQSRADFIAKYFIALKEARETSYRLRLLLAGEVLRPNQINDLLAESNELAAMIASALVTARRGKS